MRPAVPALALAALLSLTACAGDDETPFEVTGDAPTATPRALDTAEPSPVVEEVPTPDPEVEEGVVLVSLDVSGGQVTGDTERVEVPVGDTVRLLVTSDVEDEVHVHGYDQYLDLAPGIPSSLEVEAVIPGLFEVELHDSGLLLTRLQES